MANATPTTSIDAKGPLMSSGGYKRASFQDPHSNTLPVQNVYQFNVRVNNNNSSVDNNYPKARKVRPTSSYGTGVGINMPPHKRRPQSAKREMISGLKVTKNTYGSNPFGSPLICSKKGSKLDSTAENISFMKQSNNIQAANSSSKGPYSFSRSQLQK